MPLIMDEHEFWQLIDRSRDAAPDDVEQQSAELRALLADRPREDLEGFARTYETVQTRLYHWDVWAAGYLLAGGMSDDSFADFREWLISRGERIARLALEDTDALADALPPTDDEDVGAEGFGYAIHELYEERFGEQMPIFDDVPRRGEPAGEDWDEDDESLSTRLPRLYARTDES
jgi:hypothetical protein